MGAAKMNKTVGMIRVLARVIALALGLLVLGTVFTSLPMAKLAAQTETPPQRPNGPGGVPRPGNRICCSFGFALGCNPAKLDGHDYGNTNQYTDAVPGVSCAFGEPVGYVYTGAAGLVDIGHVRDNADMTFSVYKQLMAGNHSIAAGGDTVGVVILPTGKDIVGMAGAIAYVGSVGHELETWGVTDKSTAPKAQDFSAYSPEDLSSNIVGIEVATRAINNGGGVSVEAFDKEMDMQLTQMMTDLDAQEASTTIALLAQIKYIPGGASLAGKWWMDDPEAYANTTIRILRRNFDGKAWKIAGAKQDATPQWLNTGRFSMYYSQFLFLINIEEVADATQVPKTSQYALQPPDSRILLWTPIPDNAIPTAGRYTKDATGNFEILDTTPQRAPQTHGQFAEVNMNVYPNLVQANIADIFKATGAIQAEFIKQNPGGMDGP
jgi:hypothetical protein